MSKEQMKAGWNDAFHPNQELEMGRWEVRGHPHREFEASLGYLRPYLKMQNKQKQMDVCYEWGRRKTKQVGVQG